MKKTRRRFRHFAFCILNSAWLLLACGCSRNVRVYLEEPYPEKLSSWRLFTGKASELHPNQGVIPYDVNTPLFSDYAEKRRTVWMPAGQAAVYHPTGAFDFPVGTTFSKTFHFGRRLIETRLLVRTPAGWIGLPYVWNEQQSEAFLRVEGDTARVRLQDATAFEYMIPNVNQCKGCHDQSKRTEPLGPKARHLNRDFDYPEGRQNQLAYWTRIGYLKGAPPDRLPRTATWDDPASGTATERARAYLDVNCAHCHNPAGPGNTSGLDLRAEASDPLRLGVCKVPVAAGRGSGDLRFGIAPGAPDQSILVHRMLSTEPKVIMPELGRVLVHREGVALMREWIASLDERCE